MKCQNTPRQPGGEPVPPIPPALNTAAYTLTCCDRPWYIAGGWATDLFLGRITREHHDVDIAIARHDQVTFHRHLAAQGYRLDVIENRERRPWPEHERLLPSLHEIHATHPDPQQPVIELLLNEIDEHFVFRRDPAMTLDLADMCFEFAPGITALSPEIVLLYKAKTPIAAKDQSDFSQAWPRMSDRQQAWLRRGVSRLDPRHPWLTQKTSG